MIAGNVENAIAVFANRQSLGDLEDDSALVLAERDKQRQDLAGRRQRLLCGGR
jgi:hypothetical protein